jgi:hypothetical protein
MPLLYQQSKIPPLPEAIWDVCILVVWNKAAREQLITNEQSWLEIIKTNHQMQHGISEMQAAKLSLNSRGKGSIAKNGLCRLPRDSRNTAANGKKWRHHGWTPSK